MSAAPPAKSPREWPFLACLGLLAAGSVGFWCALVGADLAATSGASLRRTWSDPAVLAALRLSLVSSLLSALVATWLAVPLGYLLARFRFWGRPVVALVAEVPLVLPPTVAGVSLLVLFAGPLSGLGAVAYTVPAVVIAQTVAVTAFATQLCRETFSRIPDRGERVARSLGCSRGQAFWRVTWPEARAGVLGAASLAWIRALGEFGPVLVFAGVSRHRTEVLSTTVYLELNAGRLDGALSVSVGLLAIAGAGLATVRLFGGRGQ